MCYSKRTSQHQSSYSKRISQQSVSVSVSDLSYSKQSLVSEKSLVRNTLGVKEPPLEGIQEVVPGLWGFIRLVIHLGLFLDEGVHFFSLDQGHGERHPSFVGVERWDSFVES